jgi:hypothetical protein
MRENRDKSGHNQSEKKIFELGRRRVVGRLDEDIS